MSCASYENTLQIYSILSTMEQNLRRIYVPGINFCSMEAVMYREICVFVSALLLYDLSIGALLPQIAPKSWPFGFFLVILHLVRVCRRHLIGNGV